MICVDASVVAKWLVEEERSEQAESLLADAAANGRRLIAPHLLPFEVTNVIRRYMLRGGLTLEEGKTAVEKFLATPVAIMSLDRGRMHQEALTITAQLGLPAAYDAHYLALARFHNCPFWTDDQRLLRAIGSAVPNVHWLGDYQPGS